MANGSAPTAHPLPAAPTKPAIPAPRGYTSGIAIYLSKHNPLSKTIFSLVSIQTLAPQDRGLVGL